MSTSRPKSVSNWDTAIASGATALRTTANLYMHLSSKETPNYETNFSLAAGATFLAGWIHLFGCSTTAEAVLLLTAAERAFTGARQANIGDINTQITSAREWLEDKIYGNKKPAMPTSISADDEHPLKEAVSESEKHEGELRKRNSDNGDYGDYTGATLK